MFRSCARISVALLLLPVAAAAAGNVAPLADAVKQHDLDTVRALLQQHVDVNASEADGSTALHWAAHHGNFDAVDLLLRAGADAAVGNYYGVTPLALAAANGDAAVVERLLEGGADLNAALAGGETSLMTAARAGRIDAVRVLLAHGADVNAQEDTRGQTALMWAAAEGHGEVIRALIAAGGDLRAVSHGPTLPEDMAARTNRRRRWGIHRVDTFTPLQFAVQTGQIEATRALLDAGASLADETPDGMGLLTLAIANAHYELAALLVEYGADVDAANSGLSPLHQLIRVRTLNIGQFPHPVPTGRLSGLELAEVLLQYGADVDARTTREWADGFRFGFGLDATPFLLAAKGSDAQMMRLLAAHGADPLAVNEKGTTAVMAAAGVEMFNPNEDSGTDADALEALRLAVALGGDVNGVNVNGDTALHGAVYRATTDAIKFLVENGARLDVKNKGVCEFIAGCPQVEVARTPYQLAVEGVGMLGGYRPEAAEVLRELMIELGVSPEATEVADQDKYAFGVTVK